MNYKGYAISQDSKRIDCHNPVSGHWWTEYKPLNTFSVTGLFAFHTYKFKSIEKAKQYIDTLILINNRIKETA